jgi:uncharacterized membrane protein required for colicin V production
MHLSLFDIIIFSIFISSSILGTYRGFLITTLNIVTFLLTIFLTIILSPLSEEIISEHVTSHIAVNIISIIISYLLSRTACNQITKILKEIFASNSGLIDKTFGLWVGAFRGYFLCVLLYVTVGMISSSSYVGAKNYWQVFTNIDSKQYPNWLLNSYTYNILQANYVISKNYLDNSIIEKYLEDIELPKAKSDSENSTPSDPQKPQPKTEDLIMDQIQNNLNTQTE